MPRYVSISTYITKRKPRNYSKLLSSNYDSMSKQDDYEHRLTKFMDDAILLKKETNGIINLFETQTNSRTVYDLFIRFSKSIKPDPIKYDEAVWIESSKSGAIIWGQTYRGNAYKYDYVSMYPSCMKNTSNIFPIKRGTFKKITQDEFNLMETLAFGIYRCYVKKSENVTIKKLFRWNDKNFYTHVDLMYARKLGLKIKIVTDYQPNFLYYSPQDCLDGDTIFGKYIDFVFPLKYKELPRSKGFLSALWGIIGGRNELGYDILRNDPLSIRLDSLKYQNGTGSFYKTDFARTIPYILAYARQVISDTMAPFIDNIVRCHTDGFISKEFLNIKTGKDLGELRYEGFCEDVVVHNANMIDGEFSIQDQ